MMSSNKLVLVSGFHLFLYFLTHQRTCFSIVWAMLDMFDIWCEYWGWWGNVFTLRAQILMHKTPCYILKCQAFPYFIPHNKLYCEMHIRDQNQSSELLTSCSIYSQYKGTHLGWLSYMHAKKGVLKGWHKGAHAHHNIYIKELGWAWEKITHTFFPSNRSQAEIRYFGV